MPTGSIYNVYPNGRPSGLPDDIVSQLVQARQKQKLQPIEQDIQETQQRKDNYSALNEQLRSLFKTADQLDVSNEFEVNSASSTYTDVATASASSGAETGSYNLSVNNVAKAHHLLIGEEDGSADGNVTRGVRDPGAVNHVLVGEADGNNDNNVTQGVASADTDLVDTTFEFNDGTTHSYDTTGLSLQGLADEINNDSNTSTQAEVTQLQNGEYALSLKNDSNDISSISGDIYGSGLETEQDEISETSFQFDHNGTTHSYNTSDMSLEDLADAINNDDDADVWAHTVELANGQYALGLKSNSTGTGENAITNVQSDAVSALETEDAQAAQDANFDLDGINYTRSSNEVSDIIPGVTMSLKDTGDTTIDVSLDSDGITQKVQNMVNAFNQHDTFMKEKATYNEEEEKAGPLLGNSLARSTDNRINNILTDRVIGTNDNAYQYLSQVGIHSQDDGTLEFNSTEFQNALAENPEDVKELFVGENGAAGKMKSYLQAQTSSVSGVVTKAINSTEDQISELKDDYSDAKDDINAYRNRLQDKYSKLEQKILEYQTQEKQLSRAIDTWDTSSDK